MELAQHKLMNIKIPNDIINLYNSSNEIYIEFIFEQSSRTFKLPKNGDLIAIEDDIFNNSLSVKFHVDLISGEGKVFTFEKYDVMFPKQLQTQYPAKYKEFLKRKKKVQ